MNTIFSAYDVRGHIDDTLTPEHAWTVGRALSEYLPDEGCVALAWTAEANQNIVKGFVEGILLMCRDVYDCGQGEVQDLVGAIREHKGAGGALISHDTAQNMEVITIYDASEATITQANGLISFSKLVDSGNFIPPAKKGNLLHPR